jgi:hypothetical protein
MAFFPRKERINIKDTSDQMCGFIEKLYLPPLPTALYIPFYILPFLVYLTVPPLGSDNETSDTGR